MYAFNLTNLRAQLPIQRQVLFSCSLETIFILKACSKAANLYPMPGVPHKDLTFLAKAHKVSLSQNLPL